jgi:serine/threonine-protein kinase PknK
VSQKRPPAPPPDIPGYNYLALLGSGGFSDVFLYEQDRPRRKVAVKVLISDLKTESARRRFESEANLMAQLSSHPYIVTIYEAEVTAGGHSYLAMEYCSRPSLDVRYRRARFSVDEVLAVGVQVASAVETAHRAGIAHRDIKPANILVTDYNRPALTDFGISGTMDATADEDAGMSIPWSPPESFTGQNADGVKVDVWALGATLYTLLAGRSPFVLPGADNSQRELIARIGTAALPPLGRADVPESLELVLATAMAKSPESRYASAQDFARALQRIQNELGFSVTPFEVQEETPHEESAPPDGEAEETRVRNIISIDPDSTTGSSKSRFPAMDRSVPPAAPDAGTGPGAAAGTVQRPDDFTVPGAAAPQSSPAPQVSSVPGVNPARADQGFSTAPRGWTPGSGTPEATEDSLAATVARPRPIEPESLRPGGKAKGKPGAGSLWAGAISVLVLVAAVVLVLVLVNANSGPAPSATPTAGSKTPPPPVDLGLLVPQVADLTAVAGDGGANWSWRNPDPQPGDSFQWAPVDAIKTGDFKGTGTPNVFVANNAQNVSCISVILVRANGKASDEEKKCFPQ